MGALTLAEVIAILCALIGATPKMIQIIEEMKAKDATFDTMVTPEQHAAILAAVSTCLLYTSRCV